jgi:hypothetical protein
MEISCEEKVAEEGKWAFARICLVCMYRGNHWYCICITVLHLAVMCSADSRDHSS